MCAFTAFTRQQTRRQALPAATGSSNSQPPGEISAPQPPAAGPARSDICHTIGAGRRKNALPVEFFARVIWQESRFNARAVTAKAPKASRNSCHRPLIGAASPIPFNLIEALRHSASYLGDLRNRFGNLGLTAAGYNAGPGRVSAWLAGQRPLPVRRAIMWRLLPAGRPSEWASPAPPQTAATTIPQGVPCTQLANLILAPKEEARRVGACVARWGAQLTANWFGEPRLGNLPRIAEGVGMADRRRRGYRAARPPERNGSGESACPPHRDDGRAPGPDNWEDHRRRRRLRRAAQQRWT